jgi:hypothetical protein
MRSKLKVVRIACISLAGLFGVLASCSYQTLLKLERQFMPAFATSGIPYERRVAFRVLDPMEGIWLPHWKVAYYVQRRTELTYIHPSISVDILGRVVSTTSKEVYISD